MQQPLMQSPTALISASFQIDQGGDDIILVLAGKDAVSGVPARPLPELKAAVHFGDLLFPG